MQLDVFSAKVCMKIDLYNDRKVTVDDDNTDCSPEGFNESATYEIYEYHQTDTIHYRKSSSSEWKGQISFGEDETVTEARFDINYYNPSLSVFEIDLITPSCYKPSVMPSNPPTPAPSQCAIDEVIGKTYIFQTLVKSKYKTKCHTECHTNIRTLVKSKYRHTDIITIIKPKYRT